MEHEYHVDENLLQAFHLMYDNYPESVQLTHKSRTILAINPAAKAMGKDVGLLCSKIGSPERHRICQANKALKDRKPTWVTVNPAAPGGRQYVTFWLPIEGYPDLYIHFSCGNSMDYAATRP
ncbi:MAG: hypothetical protein LBF58_00790 [Deltaproteobacteria bacterium]|jgi:hypothetical protein|nr:hypothetical protein [Deltaproteobacteria bacterium]